MYNAFTRSFDLKGDTEEKKIAKIHQIFKSRSKNKTVPDIKVTHAQTNRFLTRILGKSSSDDNLASGSTKGHSSTLDGFKAKSLSSNEINCNVSPVLSRTCSVQRIAKKKGNYLDVDGSVSLHGSFESLDSTAVDADVAYKCPYDADCPIRTRGKLMASIQTDNILK